MRPMKTPGVYIVEKSAFPNSVVQVETAVPAFVGFTEIAVNGKKSLRNTPWRITSMAEFHQYFGGEPKPMFDLVERSGDPAGSDFELSAKTTPDPLVVPEISIEAAATEEGEAPTTTHWDLVQKNPAYALYGAMRLFFNNGGGACYIVSVGGYTDTISDSALMAGIDKLVKEPEPTMVVIPETTRLNRQMSQKVQQKMVSHAGLKMKSRVAILDMFAGHNDRKWQGGDPVVEFRNDIGVNQLDFAVSYYPWLNTSVFGGRDFGFANITPESRPTLIGIMKRDLDPADEKPERLAGIFEEIDLIAPGALKAAREADEALPEEERKGVPDAANLDKTLRGIVPVYKEMTDAIAERANCMPPAAAMAGIYTMVDNTRGVWKAPANVSLNAVVSPTVNISHDDQEDLNVTPQGKSINAIRPFVGEGVLVWGARTLDGNSLDWRYVNVRRTMIMLEESIRLASKAYVFEPNTANTWVTMRSMIENFLTGIWKQGGLAGAVPTDAFSVHVGLGETMTPEDILEGILRITVLVAISRPAEFIEITFQQQMQRS